MATELAEPRSARVPTEHRCLLVIWQDPVSRLFVKIGRLTELPDGYRFEYLEGSKDPSFEPLQSFPERDSVYLTPQLPAFFRNRVMSRQRASYPEYASWLGLDPAANAPFEVLARTGGGRATDTFHIVEEPSVGPSGRAVIRFFASGLRHVPEGELRLQRLVPGDRLYVRPEPENPVNARALLIDVRANEPVGWVPDWLLEDVHQFRDSARVFQMLAERVNVSAPAHLKLLCRLEVEGR